MVSYCKGHTKHINALCGERYRFLMLQKVVHIITTEIIGPNKISYGCLAMLKQLTLDQYFLHNH